MEPEAESSAEQHDEAPSLIDRLGAGRVFAAVVVAVGAIVAIASLSGSDETPAPPETTAQVAAPTTTPAAGPEVAPIDTCTLLPESMVDEALGLVDESGTYRSSGAVMFELREMCRWEAELGDTGETVTLELGPGDQDDFAADTTIEGVASSNQPDVGDIAVWYGGDDRGVMSAATDTDNGVLMVRLAIERAEIDDATRRTFAAEMLDTAIQRIRFGPPPPVEVDLCDLIGDEDAETLLAPHRDSRPAARDEVLGGGSPQVVDLAEPGDASCQKLILTEIYVTAAMGAESDFGPDAEIDGVTGRPIVGIGDEAMWFEAVPGTGSFAAPHDTDIIAVRSGRGIFRIITALPDLDRRQQIDATTHLALVALTHLPGGGGTVVGEHLPAIDTADVGFVDNVLARAEEGDWTIGDGIVATLQLFAGESEPDAVLRSPELADTSATEIMRMARAYLEDGPDAASRREIERLLGILGPPSFGVPEEDQSEANAVTPTPADRRVTAMFAASLDLRLLAQAEEEENLENQEAPATDEEPVPAGDTDRGYAPPPEFPDDDPYLPLEDTPIDVGCNFAGGNGWTSVPAYDSGDADVDVSKAQIIFPETGLTAGWNELHLERVRTAVQETLDLFSPGSTPCLQILLSTHGGSSSWVLDTIAPNVCGIFLNTPMQSWEEPRFTQAVARDIAHCTIPVNWPDQYGIATYTDRQWWNGGLAEFLGNVVFPAPQCQAGRCDLEWRLSSTLKTQEPTVPMMHRQDANWLFFQHLWWLGGLDAVVGLVNQLPTSADPLDHEITVGGIAGMSEVFHDFTETLTDGAVKDSGGGAVPYDPTSEPIDVSGARTIQRNLDVFGMKRLHLRIDSGKTACVESESADTVLVTYRPGAPGAGGAGAEWESLPTENTPLTGELMVVATTTDPDGSFSIEVTDVVDEGEECEEEEDAPEPADVPDPPCLAVCGPSNFYKAREQLDQWFRDAIGS